MIEVSPTTDLVKWYSRDTKPQCLSCGLYIVNFHDTSEAVGHEDTTAIICRSCSREVTCSEYDSLEDLRKDTGGEARGRAVTDAIDRGKEERAEEYRDKQAKKAARKKAKAKKTGSGTGSKKSSKRTGSKLRIRQPKTS